jgi:hypothetical protein
MRSMIISAKATLMVKCCTNQARPGTSVTALSSACLKCSDTTGSEFVISSCAPCVPRQLSDKDQNAHDAPEITFTKAGAWAWRHLCNEKVSLTTLITKLLTNPLAQSRSTGDAGDHSPASKPLHHTARLSMAWKRSGVRVP